MPTSLNYSRFVVITVYLYSILVTAPAIHAQKPSVSESLITVSVEPFANVTAINSYDWMGIGIAETVAARLGTLENSDVARASSIAGVPSSSDLVITGTYQLSNQYMRITARIADAETRRVLASVIVDGTVGRTVSNYKTVWSRSYKTHSA